MAYHGPAAQPKVQRVFNFPPELDRSLRDEADRRGTSATAVVVDALRKVLSTTTQQQ